MYVTIYSAVYSALCSIAMSDDESMISLKYQRRRKHCSNPGEWKDVKRKQLRDSRRQYISRKGQLVHERKKSLGYFNC